VKIFGCDINLDAAKSTKSRIEKLIPQTVIDVVKTDVTKSSEVDTFVQECMKKHNRIDILVNNVGRSERGGPADMSEEVWDSQVDINLKSVYLTSHFVLPIMEAQSSGAVVNISSVVSIRYAGKPQVAYAATKAAVTQFTKHTAILYAKKGVRLNAVLPGLMFTPLVEALAKKYNEGNYEGMVQMRHDQVPTGQMGTSTDVANAVVFLCSHVAAGYITYVPLPFPCQIDVNLGILGCSGTSYETNAQNRGQKLTVDGGIVSSTGRT